MVTRAQYLLRVFFSGLALALVLAQTLGLLHGVVHSPLAESAASAHAVDSSTKPDTWVERLFAGHSDESDCRVYDQLRHADAAPTLAAVALSLVLTPFVFSLLSGLAVARWHALFQARGPPPLLR
jgi:hypothetical protein